MSQPTHAHNTHPPVPVSHPSRVPGYTHWGPIEECTAGCPNPSLSSEGARP